MILKKIFYKFTNKKKYQEYKRNISIRKKIKILKSGFEEEIKKVQDVIKNQKEISFLISGHLGDVINALPVIKELSKNYSCNYYLRINKKLRYYHPGHPSGNILLAKKSAEIHFS